MWWHWLSAGIFLLFLDLLVLNSFYLLWMGLGMLPVALLLTIFPSMPIPPQVFVWIGSSSSSIIVWRMLRNTKKVDLSNMVGITCVVATWNEGRGQVRLQRPYGGLDVWDARSDEQFAANDACRVTAVDAETKYVTLSKT